MIEQPKEVTIPAATWGHVAHEAMLRHPFKSGALDLGFGGTSAVVGAVIEDPLMFGLGAGITAFGVSKMRRFSNNLRYPGGKPIHLPPGPASGPH